MKKIAYLILEGDPQSSMAKNIASVYIEIFL